MDNRLPNYTSVLATLSAEEQRELAGKTVAISVDREHGLGILAHGSRNGEVVHALTTNFPGVMYALFAMPGENELSMQQQS